MTAKDVTDYAIQGDKIAQRAFEITGEYFGRALADTVAVLNPEAIFLFGGLINSGELLFKPTQKHFDNNTLEIFKNTAKIIPSALQLQGKNIATLGASALIWKELEHKTADVL
jgi:glucokinase